MLGGCQLNVTVVVVLNLPFAGSPGIAPSGLRMAQHHRAISRHLRISLNVTGDFKKA